MRGWRLLLAPSAIGDPDPDPLQPAASWSYDFLASAALDSTLQRVWSVLEVAGATGVSTAIEEAAQRVAARGAGALTANAREVLGQVTLTAMQAEIDALNVRFPVLRSGVTHQAAIAALSMASARSLVPALRRTGESLEVFGQLPYLSLLFGPSAPPATTTALELPYRLVLSPIEAARWQHRDAPVRHRDRTELWHTRLRTAAGVTGRDGVSKIRALWSPDYPLQSRSAADRERRSRCDRASPQSTVSNLVRLMSGYDEKTPVGAATGRDPAAHIGCSSPRSVRCWMPRAHGRRARTASTWRGGAISRRWVATHTCGSSRWGYLACFGHGAALVTVTERKFESLGAPRRQDRCAASAQVHRRSPARDGVRRLATTSSAGATSPSRASRS